MSLDTAPWEDFVARTREARDRLGLRDGENCFYRGHSDGTWVLQPTLLRHCVGSWKQGKPDGKGFRDFVQDLESDLFFEFQSRARELHHIPLDDWELLFSMRHHGVATRLLDWTEVLGVAVYFALRNRQPRTGTRPRACVWLLNPWSLNQQSWKCRDLVAPAFLGGGKWDYSDYLADYKDPRFDWKLPVAIYPRQTDIRLSTQRGYFTIHGTDPRPLEEQLGYRSEDSRKTQALQKVPLPEEAIPGALEFLELAGVNEFSLFPDLDGLARYLHQVNRI